MTEIKLHSIDLNVPIFDSNKLDSIIDQSNDNCFDVFTLYNMYLKEIDINIVNINYLYKLNIPDLKDDSIANKIQILLKIVKYC